jgi:cysteinyl-tRNA synthetase
VHPREAGSLGEPAAEPDPLAIRLAMLSFPYHRPADLTEDVLAQARQTLAHWRRRVAEWAQLPSRPAPAPVADRLRAAFDDLDTATALALLQSLESDDDVPAGARFETFAYADRILGLDLARDIGRTDG